MFRMMLPVVIVEMFLLLASAGSTLAQDVTQSIEEQRAVYSDIAKKIWEYAEVGYQEEKSSALLQSVLDEAGFAIEKGVAEIPTAFVATWGIGKPVIGILAEFDALPGMSQEVSTEKKAIQENGPGHGCGHHLFGTASTAAAIAVKDWLEATKTPGTIRLYGTPAEEGGAGKVYMVREGLFNDVDIAYAWHPGDRNSASPRVSLANKSAKFRFHGVSAHAAGAPEQGRSALDGVEAMNYMVNLMREHVPSSSRIHYVITRGGGAPNVVPDFAEVYYYCRNPDPEMVKEIFERIVKAAEGAAMGTGTQMDYEVIHGLYSMLPNHYLGKILYGNLQKVGGVTYTPEETAFRGEAPKIDAQTPTPWFARKSRAMGTFRGRGIDGRGRRELDRPHGPILRRHLRSGYPRSQLASRRLWRDEHRIERDDRGSQDTGFVDGGHLRRPHACGKSSQGVRRGTWIGFRLRTAPGRPKAATRLSEVAICRLGCAWRKQVVSSQ